MTTSPDIQYRALLQAVEEEYARQSPGGPVRFALDKIKANATRMWLMEEPMPMGPQAMSHYSIIRTAAGTGMNLLRSVFPNGECDYMNFVLFSTSGVHGHYCTIEEVENDMGKQATAEPVTGVTFLIVHPRLVCLKYGNCEPQNVDDIAFLKKLRASSKVAIAEIGEPDTSAPESWKMNRLGNVLQGCAGLLDNIRAEWGDQWSEWDQAVRDGITAQLRKLNAEETETYSDTERLNTMEIMEWNIKSHAEMFAADGCDESSYTVWWHVERLGRSVSGHALSNLREAIDEAIKGTVK